MVLGFKKQFPPKIRKGIKKHTIREDKPGRWKAGNTIHMSTGVRTKNYKCFKTTTCKSVQSFRIKWKGGKLKKKGGNYYEVFVDGRLLLSAEIALLSMNDGFDCIADFLKWFSKDFKGKIIHWTNFKY